MITAEKTYPCNFLVDGYTEDFNVQPLPGVHAGARGRYRPPLQVAMAQLLRELRMCKTAHEECKLQVEWLSRQLVNWDQVDINKRPVAVDDVETILTMRNELFQRIYGIVLGDQKSDPLPEDEYAQRNKRERERHASMLGVPAEEFDEKNSLRGCV